MGAWSKGSLGQDSMLIHDKPQFPKQTATSTLERKCNCLRKENERKLGWGLALPASPENLASRRSNWVGANVALREN
ncbi:hypothetical protein KIN20_017782 [Parelaphostrongylus tenuis]|uniref:Uncharacterized protein n=1 Tax=Parelaphostrongylus tenuis TaxID=148309 RepID=A0AAD5N2V8_PARTN|nr:hypothetical protein KIN20_017782 [Parelaphostrongylus tenuis]